VHCQHTARGAVLFNERMLREGIKATEDGEIWIEEKRHYCGGVTKGAYGRNSDNLPRSIKPKLIRRYDFVETKKNQASGCGPFFSKRGGRRNSPPPGGGGVNSLKERHDVIERQP